LLRQKRNKKGGRKSNAPLVFDGSRTDRAGCWGLLKLVAAVGGVFTNCTMRRKYSCIHIGPRHDFDLQNQPITIPPFLFCSAKKETKKAVENQMLQTSIGVGLNPLLLITTDYHPYTSFRFSYGNNKKEYIGAKV